MFSLGGRRSSRCVFHPRIKPRERRAVVRPGHRLERRVERRLRPEPEPTPPESGDGSNVVTLDAFRKK